MDGNLQTIALRFGIFLLGAWLGAYAIQGLITGKTTGYYRSHQYTRMETRGHFFAWIVFRAVLAVLCLCVWAITG